MDFNHILVPIVRAGIELAEHDIPRAMTQAVSIAQSSNASISLVAYDNPLPPSASYWSGIEEELFEFKQKFYERLLARFEEYAVFNNVRATSKVVFGSPVKEILSSIETDSIDLVVKEAPHVDLLGVHRLSGDDLSLLRLTRIPVWLIPENTPERNTRNVLLALDIHANDQSMNKTMLQHAYEIATQHKDGKLHVIHTWLSPFEEYPKNYFGRHLSHAETVNDIDNTLIKEHREYIDKLLHTLNLENNDAISIHIVNGTASTEISKLAQSLPADLMVIGSHARTGIDRFFNGNTAENISAATQCPLLVFH
ncbi:universal stress protein [Candidatus Sororendozoicomonas aggregata]|uniref:universal stress protein n=1 Tax=Candidatus Sororendozoicomonas aggregata TaxID=3073239 RepID=UPI002ED6C0CB